MSEPGAETRRARRILQTIVVLVLWGLITHGTYAGSGDEPHYLAIAHSIAFDGDFDLANNYGANEPLVGGGVLQPEAHVRPGVGGIVRPVHDVGLPLVFAPVVRMAVPLTHLLTRLVPPAALQRARLNPPVLYRHLLSFAMIALTAVLSGLMFDACISLGASARIAVGVTALLVLSPPLLIFSALFFTELLSALLVFLVFDRACVRDVKRAATWWWLGCATGFLLLLHVRNLGLVVPLAGIALYRLRAPSRRPECVAFAAGVALLVAIRTAINYQFWGTLLTGPHARPGEWMGLWELMITSATRLTGLLVDQEYGLLAYAPVYAAAMWGAWALANRNRGLAWSLFVTGGIYAAIVVCPLTNVHGWTGGWSPPARFLTPIAPLLGLCVFEGLRAAPRVLTIGLVTLQIAISAYTWQHPKILWNDGDGRAAFCEGRACPPLPALTPDR
jgi:hypothetical protein